jgi:hypothetical protein
MMNTNTAASALRTYQRLVATDTPSDPQATAEALARCVPGMQAARDAAPEYLWDWWTDRIVDCLNTAERFARM